ncbi:MAG: hypothetical protein ONB44_17795 [candidate division KSB1 bacterium]|nr:hypothetical protein [candidate division KSB1 bacterium]
MWDSDEGACGFRWSVELTHIWRYGIQVKTGVVSWGRLKVPTSHDVGFGRRRLWFSLVG